MRNVIHFIDSRGPGGAETVFPELVAGLEALVTFNAERRILDLHAEAVRR